MLGRSSTTENFQKGLGDEDAFIDPLWHIAKQVRGSYRYTRQRSADPIQYLEFTFSASTEQALEWTWADTSGELVVGLHAPQVPSHTRRPLVSKGGEAFTSRAAVAGVAGAQVATGCWPAAIAP
jgi:hypothetical protein